MKKMITVMAAVVTAATIMTTEVEALKWVEIGEYYDREIKRVWIYKADARDTMADIVALIKPMSKATEDEYIIQYYCGNMDAWGAKYDTYVEVLPGGATFVYANTYKRMADGRLRD